MNSSGFIRRMMAINMEAEQFLQKVCETIERQLRCWDETYTLRLQKDLLKADSYKIEVDHPLGKSYVIMLIVKDVQTLQRKSPYALDHFIWWSLEEKGLMIRPTVGNYLMHCNLINN